MSVVLKEFVKESEDSRIAVFEIDGEVSKVSLPKEVMTPDDLKKFALEYAANVRQAAKDAQAVNDADREDFASVLEVDFEA
jgi:L-fucose mutarotase/ribose pyranase (RbsD/FucU family)